MIDNLFFCLLNIIILLFLYLYRNKNIIFIKFYFICFYIYFLPGYIDYNNNQITLSKYYITYVSLSNIFLILGFMLLNRNTPKFKKEHVSNKHSFTNFHFFFLLVLLLTLFFKISEIGWSFQGLLQAYLKSESESEYNISIIQNFLSIFLISCNIFFWTEAKNRTFLSKTNTMLVLIIGLFFLLRGNRNPLMLLFLPILIYFLIEKNYFKFRYLLFFGLLAYFIADYLDAFRANGLGFLIDNKTTISRSYELKSVGEFGVQNRVWDWIIGPNWNFNNFYFGSTYIIHPILNILTSVGLNFITISGQYSNLLSSPDKIVGIGFSPYVESYINFGIFGPIAFIFIGILLAFINNTHNNNLIKNRYLKYRLLFLFPLILNFNRIDFAVLLKFFFIYWLSNKILYFFLIKFNFQYENNNCS